MIPPPVRLQAGDYTAQVSVGGAALDTLRWRGRDLVRSIPDDYPLPNYRGAVLLPWPNRIADGRYEFDGEQYQLPLTEVGRGCALHGLVVWQSWDVVEHTGDRAVLETVVWPRIGYPFPLQARTEYVLDDAGLAIVITATNVGPRPAPYGVSIHPYLVAGAGPIDDWTLHVDAAQVVEVDADRLLPRATVPVDGTDFDFRTARRIGTAEIDHALTGLGFDGSGRASATLTAADGNGVRMDWDDTCRWVQVHTTDTSHPRTDRSALAFEPMTCPPDAFNSGEGLIVLPPGGAHDAAWRLSSVSSG